MKAIAESDLSRNVTIKGGVVMRSITGNIRRATQDMDLDFIRYSLNEDAIRQFIDKLNCLEGISIKITGKIEELSQQEYRGKRVYVVLEDDTGHSFKSKIDLGVHKNIQVVQDESGDGKAAEGAGRDDRIKTNVITHRSTHAVYFQRIQRVGNIRNTLKL